MEEERRNQGTSTCCGFWMILVGFSGFLHVFSGFSGFYLLVNLSFNLYLQYDIFEYRSFFIYLIV